MAVFIVGRCRPVLTGCSGWGEGVPPPAGVWSRCTPALSRQWGDVSHSVHRPYRASRVTWVTLYTGLIAPVGDLCDGVYRPYRASWVVVAHCATIALALALLYLESRHYS